MTLAGSGAASFFDGFRVFSRSRYRWLCRFRFRFPAAVARQSCRAFFCAHFRASF